MVFSGIFSFPKIFFFLMWTIFKLFSEFVTILLLFYALFFWLWGMWDLSSLTRDQTHTLCVGRWSLNHWTDREVPSLETFIVGIPSFSPFIPIYWSAINRDGGHSSVGKESSGNAGDLGSIPGSGRSPEEGNGNPLQYSCLENPMDRGAWQATVYRVTRVGHNLVTKERERLISCCLPAC